jgi:hypothetical protein
MGQDGGCLYYGCPRAHVLSSGKVLSINEYIDHRDLTTRRAKYDLSKLASNNVPLLRQPKHRLNELDHDNGEEVMFVDLFCTHRDQKS